jgi:uncharacterized protein YodC (DUF2158 family)
MMEYGINPFVMRQTDTNFAGTFLTEKDINTIIEWVNAHQEEGYEGYAPFVRNFRIPVEILENTTCGEAEITSENVHLLKSGYKMRVGGETRGELRYLTRWFEGLPKQKAASVTACFYSTKHMAEVEKSQTYGISWDLITVLGGANPAVDPSTIMAPETIIRNAMGAEFGGSGKSIDRAFYEKMVDHATSHAIIG